jgi:hypothetical protein
MQRPQALQTSGMQIGWDMEVQNSAARVAK